MRDPVKDFLQATWDKLLINLDELKHLVFDKTFWLGTLSFAARVLVMLLDGCMRRGIPS